MKTSGFSNRAGSGARHSSNPDRFTPVRVGVAHGLSGRRAGEHYSIRDDYKDLYGGWGIRRGEG